MSQARGNRSGFLENLGGEAGCQRLAAEFYARVARDRVLRPLFPGKSLRCATVEFSAFLVQFLGGDEEQTQHRWWLSLRESHARFRIGAAHRTAWLGHMAETLDAVPLGQKQRAALMDFFTGGSGYVMGRPAAEPGNADLAARWAEQRQLDDMIAAIAAGDESAALALAPRFAQRPSVFVGLLARMMQSRLPELLRFAISSADRDPSLGAHRFGGRTLLHLAAGAGCLEVVDSLLRGGTDPDILDCGSHTPLYSVANECANGAGPAIVRALIRSGADANASGGATRATPLHMAARRGFADIAIALLDHGAAVNAQDRKGETPLRRALNCRQPAVARLLADRGGR